MQSIPFYPAALTACSRPQHKTTAQATNQKSLVLAFPYFYLAIRPAVPRRCLSEVPAQYYCVQAAPRRLKQTRSNQRRHNNLLTHKQVSLPICGHCICPIASIYMLFCSKNFRYGAHN